MKHLLRIIGIPLLLAACTQTEDVTPQNLTEGEVPVPISFGAYLTAASTRGTTYYDMTASTLTSTGFGVFAKVNDATVQNFMYNEQVSWSGSAWSYSPLKYWPEATNTLSFYAYAPYAADGSAIDCLTTIPSGGSADPKIGYTAATDYPTQGTDLLWAINTNQSKPTSTPKETKLTFNHACVRLGLKVIANYDETGTEGKTKILIKEVKIQSGGNAVSLEALRTSGTLDLTSPTQYKPEWDVTESTAFSLPTLIDNSHDMNTDLEYTPLQTIGIPNSGQDEWGICARSAEDKTVEAQFECLKPGVTTTAKPLQAPLADGSTYYYTLVPNPAAYGNSFNIPIEITYHVITLDSRLPNGYSDIEATRSATATITDFKAGHIYTLLLRIGLKHIAAECEVNAWTNSTEESTTL